MASTDGLFLDEDGFALYNALLSHYIYLNRKVTPKIDELFLWEDEKIEYDNPDE